MTQLSKSWQKRQTHNFSKDVSFNVSFHVKFGYMECCDFGINNPQTHVWLHDFLSKILRF